MAEPERFITPNVDEIKALLTVAPEHIQRVIIIGSQCGARIGPSELFAIKWENVDFTQKIMRIHGVKKNLKAQWREVPLNDGTLKILMYWHELDVVKNQEWIIHFNEKPVQSIKTAWNSSLRRAGINRRIRPYDLRHAFATELIANGADIGTVAKLMGHSTPTMILTHYQYVMDKQKRLAIETLPSLDMCPNVCVQNKRGYSIHCNPLKSLVGH